MDSEFPMRRWAVVALALVAAVAVGTFAYQAGVSQGIALQPPPVVAAPAAPGGAQVTPAPAPYPYYPYRYYRRGPFGFFGFIGPLFGLIFFIFVMRAIFWGLFGFGCGWGWRRRWRHYDGSYDPDYGPSRFDDWHRRAHDRMRDDRGPAPTTNV